MRDQSRPILHIYCDGGGAFGYGHIRRSLTLSHRLKQDGFLVSVMGLSDEAKKLLPDAAYQNESPQVVVMDCPPGRGLDVMKNANQKSSLTVGLDWFCRETLPLINITIFPHYPVLSLSKSYIGFEYILIRPEIQQAKNKYFTNDGGYVFVSIGGGDLLNQGSFVATELASFGYSVLLIKGPLHDYCEDNINNLKVRIMKNPINFSELMAQSKFVVANGGGCLFEALYLGKAVLAIPQTPFEQKIVEYIRSLGGVLGDRKEDLKHFSEYEIDKVCAVGRTIIDGDGDKRISSIIQKELGIISNCINFDPQ